MQESAGSDFPRCDGCCRKKLDFLMEIPYTFIDAYHISSMEDERDVRKNNTL